MRGRVVSDCGGRITVILPLAEDDVDARLNWAGGWALRSEVRDGLTSDGILLVVQSEDNLGDVIEPPDWASWGRRVSPAKKTKSMRGRNYTLLRWPMHLRYSQDRKQK